MSIATMGDNQRQAVVNHARLISEKLDEIAKAREELKDLKAEAKDSNLDMRALGQVLKELRKGQSYQSKQLELEFVLDGYRDACGLPRSPDEVGEKRTILQSEDA